MVTPDSTTIPLIAAHNMFMVMVVLCPQGPQGENGLLGAIGERGHKVNNG